MQKVYTPEELSQVAITVHLKSHIVKDLKQMEKTTNQSIDALVTKALQMFIVTHSDYMGRNKS